MKCTKKVYSTLSFLVIFPARILPAPIFPAISFSQWNFGPFSAPVAPAPFNVFEKGFMRDSRQWEAFLTFDIFRAGSWFESVHYYSSVSRWYTNYLRNKICSEKPRGPSHRSISWLLMASESDARLQQQNGFSVSGCSQWISISLMNSRSIKVSSTLSDWRVRTLMGNGHWKNRPFHCGSSLPSEIISFRFEIRSTHSSIRYSAGSIQSVESLHHSRKREIWNSCFVRKWLKLRVYFRLSMFWTHRPDSVCRQRRISQM